MTNRQISYETHLQNRQICFKTREATLYGVASLVFCDPAGIRTQDPYIKSVLLYQLSYRISTVSLL